ncbi:MAG: DUF2062 domain-containing protein [Bacillota bacterium]|nr:DUF2062 domain-containing protein [Bacillota bacterium]
MKRRLRIIYKKLKKVMKLKGSPYFIAMGAAIGIFLNFIPSLGLGAFIAVGIAKIFKASGIAALTVNLATGFFIPLFYSLNFLMGKFLLRHGVSKEEVSDTLQQSIAQSLDVVEEVTIEPARYFYLDKLQSFSGDFFLGSIVNALLASGFIFLIIWILLKYRQYWHNKQSSDQRDMEKQEKKNYPSEL